MRRGGQLLKATIQKRREERTQDLRMADVYLLQEDMKLK